MGSKILLKWNRLFGMCLSAAVIVSFSAAPDVAAKKCDWDPIVKTKDGMVQGFEDISDTLVWKAIPFAAPPVDDLRWNAPVSPERWNGVRAETEFSSWCPQLGADGVMGNEDCLYLNVWRPDTSERKLPVFVWFHGGGNSLGSAAQDGYNGANFADQNNVVFVSFNYRIGPMGWFTHPSLREEEIECQPHDRQCEMEAMSILKNNSGNYGTLDMIKALEWVQKNINAFGGDKHNVTIAGESAGAQNVLSMLLSPMAHGLFDKAIAQSSPVRPGISMETADLSTTQILARLLVKDGLAASEIEAYGIISTMTKEEISTYFRSKSVAEIIPCYDLISFTMLSLPTVLTDGTVIVAEGSDAFENGTYPNRVPAIIGSVKDEMKLFMASYYQDIEIFFQTLGFPQGAGYAIATGYNNKLWRAKGADSIIRNMVAQPDQPAVFSYQFLWGANPTVVNPQYAFIFGSHHGRDLEYFLANPDSVDETFGITLNTEANLPGREALTNTIMDYLGNFIRTGDPNGDWLPAWPAWSNTSGDPKVITLDADLTNAITSISSEELIEEDIYTEMYTRYGPEITEYILSFAR